MEEMKNDNHQNCVHCETCPHRDCCKGSMCGVGGACRMGFCGHSMMKHRVLRWILGIIIIFALLCLGIKIGEFKALCGSGLYRGGSFNQVLPFGSGR